MLLLEGSAVSLKNNFLQFKLMLCDATCCSILKSYFSALLQNLYCTFGIWKGAV